MVRVLLDPARRGEGLGRPLVAAATAYASALGMSRLGLNVFADNAAAIRAYERLGFADVASTRPIRACGATSAATLRSCSR